MINTFVRFYATITLCLYFSYANATPVDYTKLKPTHFKNLVNGQVYEEQGQSFKVVNTKYKKGVQFKESNGVWREHGAFFYYSLDGKLDRMTTYWYGKREGKSEDYWHSGKIKHRWLYKENLLSGNTESYDEKGQLVSTTPYKNNKKDGKEQIFYKGKVEFEHIWSGGKKVETIQYNYKGKIVDRITYSK